MRLAVRVLVVGVVASLLAGCGGGSASRSPAQSTEAAQSTDRISLAPASSTAAGSSTFRFAAIGDWGVEARRSTRSRAACVPGEAPTRSAWS